jgi:hypothetical protein
MERTWIRLQVPEPFGIEVGIIWLTPQSAHGDLSTIEDYPTLWFDAPDQFDIGNQVIEANRAEIGGNKETSSYHII